MYLTKYLKKDLQSSFIIFLVALPLCLGIALASGAPLISGIISGVIGGIFVGFLSNSHTSISGPAAGLTVVVLSAVTSLGDFYSFTLAIILAGIIQVILGLVKAGNVSSYFPNSVIKGMLAAIGLVIIFKQIPHLIGLDYKALLQLELKKTFAEFFTTLETTNIGSTIIGVLSLFIILFWDQMKKKGNSFFQLIPSALVVVLIGVLLNEYLFPFLPSLLLTSDDLVSLNLANGLGSLSESIRMPNFSMITNPEIYMVAITLAVVATLETLLSVEAVDKIDPKRRSTNKNRELIVQGCANITAGFVGGLPMTSVIVRSSTNINAGAQTKTSTILHGLWILLAVLFLPFVLERIPLASLAAILILVGYRLAHPSLFSHMYKLGKIQFTPFITTIIAVLLTDLLIGIIIGVMVGFAFIIISTAKNSIIVVNTDSDYLVRFMKDVSFLQKSLMKEILDSIPNNSSVIIDGSNHFRIDNDIIAVIEHFIFTAPQRNIRYEIVKSTFAMNAFFKEN